MLPFLHPGRSIGSRWRHLRSSGLYDAGCRFGTEQQLASSLASESQAPPWRQSFLSASELMVFEMSREWLGQKKPRTRVPKLWGRLALRQITRIAPYTTLANLNRKNYRSTICRDSLWKHPSFSATQPQALGAGLGAFLEHIAYGRCP